MTGLQAKVSKCHKYSIDANEYGMRRATVVSNKTHHHVALDIAENSLLAVGR